MKKARKIIFLLALIAVLVPAAALASDKGDRGDRIEDGDVVEGDLTLYSDTIIEEGAVINGDITVLGGDLEFAGTVNGDIVVLGGDVELDGQVSGQLIVLGGDIEIGSTALINGECALIGGEVSGSESCLNPISADLNLSSLAGVLIGNPLRETPVNIESLQPAESAGFFATVSMLVFTALIAGGLGYGITSAVPSRMYEIRSAVQHKPYIAGGIGMLTTVAGSSFLIIITPILALLTLACGLGLFLGFAVAFYVVAMVVMGWITMGALIAGRFVDQSSPLNPRDPVVAGIGTGSLTLALGLLGLALPVLSWLIVTGLFFIGLGGVVLTRIGKQPFPRLPRDIDQDKYAKVMGTLHND